MRQKLFLVIKGPKNTFYILDHHHMALSLVQRKSQTVQVGVVKDLSTLKLDDFWILLDHHGWVHPYDEQGKRHPSRTCPSASRSFGTIPTAASLAKCATPAASQSPTRPSGVPVGQPLPRHRRSGPADHEAQKGAR